MGKANRIFTLVELMIVVAIIAVLAAIAIPNFAMMQVRARWAEAPLNAAGIRSALAVYYRENPYSDLTSSWEPRDQTAVNKSLVPWTGISSEWTTMGYEPDGAVRGAYNFVISTVGTDTCQVFGVMNVDGDAIARVVRIEFRLDNGNEIDHDEFCGVGGTFPSCY